MTDRYQPGSSSGRSGRGRARSPRPPAARVEVADTAVRFRPGRRRRWPRRILVLVNLAVALSIITVASAYAYIDVQFGRISTDSISALTKSGDGQPFTMLIVGSDTRNLGAGASAAFGNTTIDGGARSDTIMLARVVPLKRQITLMSIPRDLYVPIKGMGEQRINAAFNNGPNLLVQTIESDVGIPINHYVEVNFDTFRDITNALGGVRFWFPTPARDAYSNLNVPQAGCVNLTGDQALGFVRSRHYEYYANGQWQSEAESDLARIQRQQAYVKKMVDKAQTRFTNPIALNAIVSGVTKNLTVDSGFSRSLMVTLARTFRGVNSSAIPTETLPTNPAVINGADVLQLAQPAAQSTITAFNSLGAKSSSPSTTSAPKVSTKAPASAPDPSTVSVEVVNGSGVTGQAGQATTDISGAGYKATTNASTRAYGVTANEIHYAPDAKSSAQLLASKLAGGAVLSKDPSLTQTSYNLELITGSSFRGLAGSTTATTATTAAPPTTAAPAAASTSPGVYTLPGTPAGQLPPASCTP